VVAGGAGAAVVVVGGGAVVAGDGAVVLVVLGDAVVVGSARSADPLAHAPANTTRATNRAWNWAGTEKSRRTPTRGGSGGW
jgi:hypothetical protein